MVITYQRILRKKKKKKVFQPEDQINRIQNGKHPYNFNKETNSNEYCHYCHKNGHTTETCFFNPLYSPKNNYWGERKIIIIIIINQEIKIKRKEQLYEGKLIKEISNLIMLITKNKAIQSQIHHSISVLILTINIIEDNYNSNSIFV